MKSTTANVSTNVTNTTSPVNQLTSTNNLGVILALTSPIWVCVGCFGILIIFYIIGACVINTVDYTYYAIHLMKNACRWILEKMLTTICRSTQVAPFDTSVVVVEAKEIRNVDPCSEEYRDAPRAVVLCEANSVQVVGSRIYPLS